MKDYNRTSYSIKKKKRRRKVFMIKLFLLSITILLLILFVILIRNIIVKSTLGQVDAEQTDTEQYIDTSEDIYSNTAYGDLDNSAEEIELEETDSLSKLYTFAQKNNLSLDEYPDELFELLEKNPETEEFVFQYPFKKNTYSDEPLTELLRQDSVPLLLQWDERWGYYEYGDGIMGLTGCGPTCLSMVAIHLLQNEKYTPIYVAEYSMHNGFYFDGNGTAWELMTEAARAFGLDVKEVPLDENVVKNYLAEGNPIICVVGPGDFTDQGHFLVFTGLENGHIMINDPNSVERSEQSWVFDDIKGQIKNMWVYTVG